MASNCAGRLTGQRFMGEHDWYRAGCEFLTKASGLGMQHEDGSWWADGHHDKWPVISTSFAPLFLSKGRTPVLVSKLVHGPGGDWNNDRNDARNLVNYASTELFRGKPMAWQVFDTSRVDISDNDQLLQLAGELGKSSVVYFNGHEVPQFKPMEVELLKQYVEQGGFVFAEACRGRKEFDAGFRELMRQIFPDHTLKPPPNIPSGGTPWCRRAAFLWRALITVAKRWSFTRRKTCRVTGKAISPKRAAASSRSDWGATSLPMLREWSLPWARLEAVEIVAKDRQEFKRGYLKVAQLRHEGDWQPAPNAMCTDGRFAEQRPHERGATNRSDFRDRSKPG